VSHRLMGELAIQIAAKGLVCRKYIRDLDYGAQFDMLALLALVGRGSKAVYSRCMLFFLIL
jgi:hypothetical protein